jgi:hypothetical protein
VFQEYSKEAKLNWDLIEKVTELQFTKYQSARMFMYNSNSIQSFLEDAYLFKNFAKKSIKNAMNQLVPENSLIFVLQKNHSKIKEEDYNSEKWYGTHYTIGEVQLIFRPYS